MISLLIEGYYGKKNLGDDYIFVSIIDSLRKISTTDEVYVFVNSTNVDYLYKYLKIESISNVILVKRESGIFTQIKQFSKLINNVDWWIIGGGGLFPKDDVLILLKYVIKLLICKIRNKRACMYGIEINPVQSKMGKILWRLIIGKCEFIATRNMDTKIFVDSILENKAVAFSDVTFSYADKYKPENISIQHPYEVWAVAMPWSKNELKQNRYVDRYETICEQFAALLKQSKSKTIVFLPFFAENDILFIKDIISKCKDTTPSYIIIEDIPFYERRALFAGAEKCLCMRFHSLLFALYNCKPFLAISYSPKTSSILREYNLDEYMVELGIRESEFFYKEFDINTSKLIEKYNDIENENMSSIETARHELINKAQLGENYLLERLA